MTKSRDIADSINRIDSSAADAKAMTIDANENVGIGTTSPSKQLHQIRTGSASDLPALAIETGFITQSTNVAASSQNISIVSGNTGEGRLFFGDTDDEDIGGIVYSHVDNSMTFDTAGSERMRIDSSGRLLVGKTSFDSSIAGVMFDTRVFATTSGAATTILNRLSSDGDIITFRRDGTNVGSIKSYNGAFLQIESAGDQSGLLFGTTAYYPVKNGSLDNGNIDIGNGSNRFKDLYLGGGAYIGGTGSANKLDDYEEGTFNPFSGVSSAYTNETTDNAQYRKIGSVVHIDIRFDWTGTDNSANAATFALPFTASATTNTANAGSIIYSGTQLKSGAALSPHVGINQSQLAIYRTDGGSSFQSVSRNEVNGSYEFLISFTYFTND